MKNEYRIAVIESGRKRIKWLSGGQLTSKLIHASHYVTDGQDDEHQLRDYVARLNEDNPTDTFTLRKCETRLLTT